MKENLNLKPCGTFIKNIKGTTYEVNVHFSKTSRETLNDKVIRLIRNEVIAS